LPIRCFLKSKSLGGNWVILVVTAAAPSLAPTRRKLAPHGFDWSQNVADLWLGSNITQKREILDLVCLNRALSDVTLVTTKRKPFDGLAERLKNENSRGDKI